MKSFFAKKKSDKKMEIEEKLVNDQDLETKKMHRTLDKSSEKPILTPISAPKSQLYTISTFSKFLETENFKISKTQFSNKSPTFTPFFLITETFDLVSSKSGKNSQEIKKEILTRMFEIVLERCPQELVNIFYFCILRTNVEWLQKDLGIGHEILLKSVSTATGRTTTQVRNDFRNKGCLGTVLEVSKGEQNTLSSIYQAKKKEKVEDEEEQSNQERVTFAWVFENLRLLGATTGNKSQAEKENILVKMFRAASACESKYICRFISTNYKIGVAEKFFQAALSRAFARYFKRNKFESLSEKMELEETKSLEDYWEESLQKILTQFPDHGTVISQLIESKSLPKTIAFCKLTPGIPCKPMLAKPTKSLQQVFNRFENRKFTCEYKYDGLRGQIHYDRKNETLKIFSRNLEDMTLQYPDIAIAIGEFVNDIRVVNKIRYFSGLTLLEEPKNNNSKNDTKNDENQIDSFIIDSEIVAYDKVRNRILPFQVLATRARKNVKLEDEQVSVCIYVFDILFFNGLPYINKQFVERRKIIRDRIDGYNVDQKDKIMKAANYADCENIEELQIYLENSIKDGCEGLMVKTIEENATYEPAKRSFKWLKVKKDYLDNKGIGDSLDLVVVGANYGAGKRTGKFGTYLVACYNPNTGFFETAALVGTGFSDSQLDEFFELTNNKAILEKPKEILIEKNGYPDVWLSPELVFEIKAADIQISPIYKCSKNELKDEQNKGLGLRFPRFIRWRKDKNPTSATDSKFIFEIYKSQALISTNDYSDDDYY